MDNYDFLNLFVTGIARDASTSAWCNAFFGRGLKVLADLEGAALPSAADMPYALIHTPAIDKHQDRREQRYGLAVDLALDKDALSARAEPNIAQPAGVELILDLATLVAAAVKTALPANTTMGYSLSADTLGALPEVYAYMDFDFITIVTIAGDPLA